MIITRLKISVSNVCKYKAVKSPIRAHRWSLYLKKTIMLKLNMNNTIHKKQYEFIYIHIYLHK